MAARAHGDLVAVHVSSLDGGAQGSGAVLARQKLLVEELGGTVKEVAGDDVGEALVAAAKSLNATQIVLGATRRSRYAELMRGSVINRVIRASGIGIDVHVISREESDAPTDPPRRRRRPAALPARRVTLAFGLAAVILPTLTAGADLPPTASRAPEHPPSLPSHRRARLGGRRAVARPRDRRRRLSARELLLHAAHPYVHDRRGRQRRGARRLPRRGGGRERLRRPRVASRCRGSACAGRERGLRAPCRLVEHHDVARDAPARARASRGRAVPPPPVRMGGGGVCRGSRRGRESAGEWNRRSTTSTCSSSRGTSRPTTTCGFSTRSSPRSLPRSRSRSSRPRSGP